MTKVEIVFITLGIYKLVLIGIGIGIGIGIWASSRTKSSEDFVLGGQAPRRYLA